MRTQNYGLQEWAGFFLVIALFVASAFGWVANIVKLWAYDGSGFAGELVLRIVGIFCAPLGAVLGYF